MWNSMLYTDISNQKSVLTVLKTATGSRPKRQSIYNMLFLTRHAFIGSFSGTTRVSWYQKRKTNLDILEQETVSGSSISWAYANLHLAPDR